jgi:anti-sigma regulatory factor (Ser/Thr protein kinase)
VPSTVKTDEASFPAGSDAPRRARAFVRDTSDLDPEHLATVELLVSEIATNAVLHARSAFRLRMRRSPSSVHVEIFDESPDPPTLKEHSVEAPTGRGMRIVDALASRWGVHQDGAGKSVWFELDLESETP